MNRNTGASFLVGSAVLIGATLLTAIPSPAQQSLQQLDHHVRAVVSSGQAPLLGHMPSTQLLHLGIILPLQNEAALQNLLVQLYNPASANYRHFLSVDQFTQQFGPSAADYQSVVNFAKANGFSVEPAPANRLIVDIDGTVAQVEKAFNVTMNLYKHPTENRSFFSADREPSLALSVPIKHISGLNNYSLPKPAMMQGVPNQTTTGSAPGTGYFLPSDMRAAYYGTGSLTGSGQCVALGEFGGYLITDVTATLAPPSGPNSASSSTNGSNYTVTYTTGGTQYTIAVNNPSFSGYQATSDTGDVGEQALDIAQAIGMAPGISQVRVYTAPESFTSSGSYEYPAGSPGYDWDIFNAMATENACSQLSLSWHWEPENLSANDSLFEEFQAQGQSFFAASGDWGAFPTPADYYYPAEDNNVTAVGGTDLTTNGAGGAWSGETAWVYSSGGISPDYVTIPSYQQIAGVITSSNHGSTSYRNIPDVAMEANVDNYYCDHGSCSVEGGTSYAAPRWAAFMALANQQAKANGKSMVGFINPVVYPLGAGSNYTTYFHDITSGNNDCYTLAPSYCGSTTYYSAVTGYDLVTGWGSPNGSAMVNELASYAGSAPPSCTVTPQCVGSGNFANASITLSCTQAMQISTSATLCGLYGSGGCGTNNGASGILTYSNASYSGDTYSGGYCSVGWCWGGKCSSQRMTP